MKQRLFYVYILASGKHGTLYTGVTNHLQRRYLQHKEGSGSCFAKRYRVNQLVYFEVFNNALAAIAREKQIKGGSRLKKIQLIESKNPGWKDLYFSSAK